MILEAGTLKNLLRCYLDLVLNTILKYEWWLSTCLQDRYLGFIFQSRSLSMNILICSARQSGRNMQPSSISIPLRPSSPSSTQKNLLTKGDTAAKRRRFVSTTSPPEQMSLRSVSRESELRLIIGENLHLN